MVATLIAAVALASTATAETVRVSVNSAGVQSNGRCNTLRRAISADGQIIVFDSAADNLVDNDDNQAKDVFVHDRTTDITTRVSVSSTGTQGNAASAAPSISADGRYVVFHSAADNLIDGDDNQAQDVFLHDRQTSTTTRISVSNTGTQGNGHSTFGVIAANGQAVVFESHANNLADNDTNGQEDIFVRDLVAQTTTRMNVNSDEVQANGDSDVSAISANGQIVAFHSFATNLVDDDTNMTLDVFVRDRQAGTTTRASVGTGGTQATSFSFLGGLSDDGRYVAFVSAADNLVTDDTNGRQDVFVRDLDDQTTTRISIGVAGAEANNHCVGAAISMNGRYVAFDTYATNIIEDDTNNRADAFVCDRATGGMTRVSVSSTGLQATGDSVLSAITANGRYVVFDSDATDLVLNDTNTARDSFVHDRASDVPGDLDNDVDTDLFDFHLFAAAYTGGGLPTAVFTADLDFDGDCDLNDLTQFVANFTGP